ncbi:Panacea domain-containing protein [Virgibacillus alimentarius]|uniref:Panacea domain-containing protein n=1 Tax=Virgibacillus alimentarius TaxID=698769 RepID=UPI0006897AA0|nr:type II toxin-antitoxin system antitoxin SocA domain-containing protein [Virgibacillus alimentarius]
MAAVNEVVNYLLYLRNKNSENGLYFSLTNLKLQKLLYFCEAMFLVSENRTSLIEDTKFQAWRYGPVVPEIYYRFNVYGQNDIPTSIKGEFENLKQNEIKIIEEVWGTLRDKSAFDLVEISHITDGPWSKVYKEGENNEINSDDIYNYFSDES